MEEALESHDLSPVRSLVETFDFIEVCCGRNAPLSSRMAKAGFRVGPFIDITRSAAYDLLSGRLFLWLMNLISSGRLWGFHSGVPCTTYSVVTWPRLRSSAFPWGVPGLSAKDQTVVREGNFFLQGVLAIILLMGSCVWGFATHEHP